MKGRADPVPKLMTVRDAGELLSLPLSSVYALVEQGKIPCVRIGRRIRFDPGDLTRWLEARKEGCSNA